MFSFLCFYICNFLFLKFLLRTPPTTSMCENEPSMSLPDRYPEFFLCIKSMLQQVLNIYVPSRGCVLLWNIFCHGLFHSRRVERKSVVSSLSCSKLPRSSRGNCSVYLLHISAHSFDMYSTTNCMLAGLPVVL